MEFLSVSTYFLHSPGKGSFTKPKGQPPYAKENATRSINIIKHIRIGKKGNIFLADILIYFIPFKTCLKGLKNIFL
jgi:hypothetical protein